MPAEIIDGKAFAARRQDILAQKVSELVQRGIQPCLAAVSLGGDPSWEVYQKRQAKSCTAIGLDYRLETLSADASQQDLSERIEILNADPMVHGIIIQSPLPGELNILNLQAQLSPAKDIEAVSPANLGLVLAGRQTHAPCTALAALLLAKEACADLRGKEAVVVGSSVIVGKPIAQLLLSEGATPTLCHIDTQNVAEHTRRADIIFVAVGIPKFLKADMVKPGAIIIDVGINRITNEHGKNIVVGDVDPEVSEVASAMTPVPGGVGSVTTSVLVAATITAAESQQERRSNFDGSMLTQVLGDRAAEIPAALADDLARLMSQHMVQLGSDAHLRSPLERRLEKGLLILDGAIGTELIAQGVAVDAIDRVNIDNPSLVKKVHQSYVDAGVDALTTNTFGCNRYRCQSSEEAIRLAQSGVRIARQVARGRVLVLASIGPLNRVIGAELAPDEARDAFAEMAMAMSDAGADGFCVETMTSNAEAIAAISGIRQVSRLPVFVTRNIQRDDPAEIQDFVREMESAGAAGIGVNCITGVRSLTAIIARMRSLSTLPLIARPNAGYPQHIDGRYHYHLGPEYFCNKAQTYVDAGARILGGCCGIGPQHIAALVAQRSAMEIPRKALQPQHVTETEDDEVTDVCPLMTALNEQRFMRLVLMPSYLSPQRARHVAQAVSAKNIDAMGFLSAWGNNNASGIDLVSRLRFIEDAAGQPAILDIDSQQDILHIQEQLLNAHLLGIRSVIVDTGVFSAHPQKIHGQQAQIDAMQIIQLLRQLNNGRNISGSRLESACCFTIAVRIAAADIAQLSRFADAGVDFAILQPVYAPKDFRDCMQAYDHSIPLLAEVLILQDIETAEEIDNEIPALSVPQKLKDRLRDDPENDIKGVLRFIEHWRKDLAGVCLLLPNENSDAAIQVLEAMNEYVTSDARQS
ncbi:MAG: homocysteine S-methyltransferase family protein [Planctomycetes bacterium]|nr:homocysteine S-methyltransferase family protein [Planctomycetota bacterium]